MKKLKTTIGICGPRLSGKDTVADIIFIQTSINKLSLADPIKEQYSDIMNIKKDTLYLQGSEKEKHRIGLITLGAIRRFDELDWWCSALHKLALTRDQKEVVIPDIRFENEVQYFKDNSTNFILIEVTADKASLISRGWRPNFADSTTTETERCKFIDKVNYFVDNSSTIDSLKDLTKTIISENSLH